MKINLRQEQETDYPVTEQVIKQAFAHEKMSDQTEHDLVARLRKTDAFIPELSIVAEVDDKLVGQILLSRVTIGERAVESLALAPISVVPAFQKQGIGARLMKTAIEKASELGYTSVIVLGHPSYYSKFGFIPASNWNIKAPYPVPDEAFMALELHEKALKGVKGVVNYSQAFME
ncbi:GNAT family N-acetyltransferase [Ornithinibacillus sp. 4-3]|uniref:GNAT family N-acetyltransferase n=1 Tax=Ornithinibacillus sp. 4-3 TaxID=3231488 RepID=A0AB39HP44_9BACI